MWLSDTAHAQPPTSQRRRAKSDGLVPERCAKQAHSANARPEGCNTNAAFTAWRDGNRQRSDRQGRLREDGLRRRDHGGSAQTRPARTDVPPRPHPVPVGIDHRGARGLPRSRRISGPRARSSRRSHRAPGCADRRSVGRDEHHVRQKPWRVRLRREVTSGSARHSRPGRNSHRRRVSGLRLAARSSPAATRATRFERAG